MDESELRQGDRGVLPTGGRQIAIPTALLLPIVLAIVAGFAVVVSTGGLPVPEFYGTAAQVIPILLIAFAVESRAVTFMAHPRAKFYRFQLFLFLLIGELSALLGASGALREQLPRGYFRFTHGLVASSSSVSNVIAAVTAASLVGGFVMVAVLAMGGPGWLVVSRSSMVNGPLPAGGQQRDANPSSLDA